MEQIFAELGQKTEELMNHFRQQLGQVRTGRASPSLVENLRVEYYGTLTPLNQLASIKVPEARLLMIEPWDKSALSAVEKAIANSELGLAPTSDGQVIRISIPPLNEERRKELSKLANKHAEEAKASLRNIRNKTKEHIKALGLSEDETFRQEKRMQEEVDKYHKQIDEIKDKKIAEIMEI